MSGNTWLARQRKMDLVDLAEYVGLENYEGLRKPELELVVDEFLWENAAHFETDPELAPYFTSRSKTTASPSKASSVKRDYSESVSETKSRVQKRRGTKTAVEMPPPEMFSDEAEEDEEEPEEPEEPVGSSTALIQTPGRNLALASRIPLPPTPADVAQAVDRSTIAVRSRVTSLYQQSGITEATRSARSTLSTVHSLLLLSSAFEMYFLRPEILPDRYAFTVPAVRALGSPDYPVMVPDLFLLLTASFWSPATLWALTSVVLPTVAGYFFNLTVGAKHGNGSGSRRSSRSTSSSTTTDNNTPDHTVDPLMFSIAKAIFSFVVYGQKVTFGGWTSQESIARVDGAVYGGYKGLLVGAAVTGVTSIYDAVLKK